MIVIFVMSSLEHMGVLQWLSSVNQMASTNAIINIPAEQPCGLTLAYHLGGGGCVLPGYQLLCSECFWKGKKAGGAELCG